MDTLSHGLWGGVAFGRKKKIDYMAAVFFGAMPDIFSFGIYMVARILGFSPQLDWSKNHPTNDLVPTYVHHLYDITHSLIVFGIIFGLVYLFRKKPFWPLSAWGLHILMDIPGHSYSFFPTPFLWPISDFRVNGISWGNPIIFFPNVILLIISYAFWYWKHRKNKKNQSLL